MHEISIHEVTAALDRAGLTHQVKGRYIVSQCPKHQEKNPSCQIFLDDWFCSCLAGCGRFPITDPFPELRGGNYHNTIPHERRPKIENQRTYQSFELTEDHARLPLIPESHEFKNLPISVLNDLGWRWDEGRNSYFIPYYNQDRTKIPFAQWRHLSGPRRFTFLPGAKPTMLGKWNIEAGGRLFIVEGSSDGAVLQAAGIPWIACPSASSGTLLKNFAAHAKVLGISLVWSGDSDDAGNTLRRSLDESGAVYRVCQPPEGFKDWGDFYEAEGQLAVFEWCKPKLFE